LKPLVYFGAALDFSRKKPLEKPGFFADLSMKFGIPMKTGTMEDRDWDRTKDPTGGLTNFSASDTFSDGAFLLDFLSGASLPIRSVVVIKPSLGLSYMHFKWTGYDGYYEYPYDSPSTGSYTGPTLVYSQNWLLLFAGLSASVQVIPKIVLALSFQVGPMLWFKDQDIHPLTNTQYIERIFGGVYLEPGGGIIFSPNDRLSLGFTVSWRYVKARPHGEMYGRQTGNGTYQYTRKQDIAGAGYRALDSNLSVIIRF
jgi:outer membrane protease